MERETPIIVKRGFFSTLAYGVSAVLVTAIICGTGVAVYGLSIADRKSDNLTTFATNLVSSVPELVEALPPWLSDALHDRREPAYRSNLDIQATMVKDYGDWSRPVVTVTNRGSEIVSVLALRVVLVDEAGRVVEEEVTYAATPLACHDEWPGPILPGETRRYRVREHVRESGLTPQIEVTEVRVWDGEREPKELTRAERP